MSIDLASARTVLAAALVLGAASLPVRAQVFTGPIAYPVSNAVETVLLGDVNGDGTIDAVTTASNSPTISVYPGDGAGTFAPVELTSAAGFLPRHPVLRDADLDGRLDVVCVNTSVLGLAVLLGNGAYGFAPGPLAPLTEHPTSLDAADVNHDGAVDVVALYPVSATMNTLLGNGAGGFGAPSAIPAGVGPVSVKLADLNRDGSLDAVVGDVGLPVGIIATGPSVVTFQGNGLGGFAPSGGTLSIVSPGLLAVSDFDRDGWLDVVAGGSGSSSVELFRNDGAGSIGFSGLFAASPNPVALAMGDVNRDGETDLVVSSLVFSQFAFTSTAVLLRNDGAGGFVAPATLATGAKPFFPALADLGADGDVDLVLGNPDLATLNLYPNADGLPVGLSLFGMGTTGCGGALGMAASEAPAVGAPDFRFLATNAPRNTLGLLLVTSLPDVFGSDPFSLGLLLHVDLFASAEVLGLDLVSEGSGAGLLSVAIPSDPLLQGQSFTAQSVWVELPGEGCATSVLHLVSSRGMQLVIQ